MAAVNELNWEEHSSFTGLNRKLEQIDSHQPTGEPVTQIEVHSNGELLAEHAFPPGRVIIGRSPDNEVYVKSKFVSRHHAQLISDDAGCVIEDLNSTNGVFLGDRQIKKYRLRDGDIISLGVHELRYRDLRQVDQEQAGPAEDQIQAEREPQLDEVAEPDSVISEQ